MPSPALLSSLLDTLDTLTDGLIGGQLSAVGWHNSVARELFAYHLAEYASAAGKDERAVLEQVKGIVAQQVEALNAFTDQIEAGEYRDRDDILRGRAALYASGLKQSYWGGRVDGSGLPCLPGGCEECYSNCRCELDVRDDGIYWQCAEDDRSCSACVERGQSWQPYGGE